MPFDDDEVVPRWSWSESQRDERVRQAVNYQAASLRQMGSEASKMRTQLARLSGNIEQRLGSLTRAFYSFVELDAIRAQLAAYPFHEQSRRYALADLASLKAGITPPERPDIDGYWLPQAMAALRVGGGVDPELERAATTRSPTARIFIAAARAWLGAPESLLSVVNTLLRTDPWTPQQQALWSLLAAGAFGPQALAQARPLLAHVVALDDRDGWVAWVGSHSVHRPQNQSVIWYADRLEAVLTPEELADRADPAVAMHTFLADLIAEGDSGEMELLKRAELLRGQLETTEDILDGQDTRQDGDRPALECLRASLEEPQASPLLWGEVTPVLSLWVQSSIDSPLPPEPEAKVAGLDATATRHGADDSLVRAEIRRIKRDSEEEDERARLAVPVMIGGGALAAAGVVLAFAAPAWLLLVLVGGITAFLGFRRYARATQIRAYAEQRIESVTRNADRAVAQAAQQYEKDLAERDELIQQATRAAAAAGRLSARGFRSTLPTATVEGSTSD